MGILNFIKKIFQEEKVEEIKKEEISSSDIPYYIKNKKKEIEVREKEIIVLIKERVGILALRINEKIDILKKVDVESKKVEDRLKHIVKVERGEYIKLLESLIDNLNNLKENKFEKIISNIDGLLLVFSKSSYTSYERTTILIGEEMQKIKDELKAFSQDLINLFNENKDIINSFDTISYIELEFKKFEEIKEEIEKINQRVLNLDQQIIFKEEQNKKILEEIERITKNPEHLEYLKRVEKVKFLEKDLEKDLQILRQLIDFKALGSFYHIFENKIRIVNLYNGDFQKNFQKDDGKEILDLLNTAKLVNENISEIITKIKNKKEEMLKDKIKNEKEGQAIQELSSASSSIILEISGLKNEKSQEEKRVKKLNANENDLISNIKEKFEKFTISPTHFSTDKM